MAEDYYVILAGGVGAAKLIEGLVHVVEPEQLKIIINTGDDIELYGLKICPDIDIITYTLANIIDKEKGWGYSNETYNCLGILEKYYNYKWFNAGDQDLATHIFRTDLFSQGYNKAEVTSIICQKLDVKAQLIPMCNENVQTFITTEKGVMHFEEYYIKHQCAPEIISVEFRGIDNATPGKEVIGFIKRAKKVIICPSNPIVSIGTILGVSGIKKALEDVRNKVYAISPIIEGTTIKGPADKLMKSIGFEVSCVGVARYYQDIVRHMIIDNKDSKLKPRIEQLGMRVYCFDTFMNSLAKKIDLAQYLINL